MHFAANDELVDVVVLAGGVNTVPLFDGYTPGYKSLIPYHEKASIQYVLDALLAVPAIGRICVEGPHASLTDELAGRISDRRLTLIEGGESFVESLTLGLEHFRDSKAVLFVAADIPLVTPAAITDFLDACKNAEVPYDADIFVSAVPESSYGPEYDHFTKPFNPYKDGKVCHGNLFLLDPALLENDELKERMDRMYGGRKSIMSRFAIGWKVAVAYLVGVDLLHTITLPEMAAIASKELGVGIAPVLIDHPEVTIDVDDSDDYAFVRDRIEAQFPRPAPCS